MTKYETLLRVLDKLREEAPPRLRRYHPAIADVDKVNQARSRALIHLYLKVKFGLLRFDEREHCVTDKGGDGGIDAYFIDKESRVIYALQSKFRVKGENFEKKNIDPEELLAIQLARIAKGESADESGNEWNGKIKQFQRELNQTEFRGSYSYKVVVLANCRHLTDSDLRRLCDGYPVEVFDHTRVYEELLFPVISGTYYKAADLEIKISLANVSLGQGRVSYTATTSDFGCNVTLVFAPVSEIGRVLAKYRNAILYFNPRSFLGLSYNSVNREIESTITNSRGNEFALFNNGITLVADKTDYSDSTGQVGEAQLVLRNPQIINGGQTAYTLCRLFERVQKGELSDHIFRGKEVLLKVITLSLTAGLDISRKLELIERISRATNLQTQVSEADRRSNEEVQIELQKHFFSKFGLFYERKKGEFSDGLTDAYIDENALVDRDTLMKVALVSDLKVSESKRSIGKFFAKEAFDRDILVAARYKEYAFGCSCHRALVALQKNLGRKGDAFGRRKYGDALRHGKFAVVAICLKISNGEFEREPEFVVDIVLSQWKAFETWAKRQRRNREYFRGAEAKGMVAYYKGKTINDDLGRYRFRNLTPVRR